MTRVPTEARSEPMRSCPLPRRPEVRLSRLGFGAASIGNLYAVVPDEAAVGTLHAAWDAGVRYFDTAPHYGLGLSESRVGQGLAGRPREDWVLSTKVGRLLVPAEDGDGPKPSSPAATGAVTSGPALQRVWDFSRDGTLRSLESSLARLGADRVDVVLVHDPDDHWAQASQEAVPALCELRDQGVIGAVGVGMNQSAMLTRFVRETDVDVVMCAGRYSLFEQPALADLLPAALESGVGVIAAGVFNTGLLARAEPADDAKYNYLPAPPEVLARARAMAEVCRSHGTTLPGAALHFPLAHEAVVSVVLGMSAPAHVHANAALLKAAPARELWADLVEHGLLSVDAPVPA